MSICLKCCGCWSEYPILPLHLTITCILIPIIINVIACIQLWNTTKGEGRIEWVGVFFVWFVFTVAGWVGEVDAECVWVTVAVVPNRQPHVMSIARCSLHFVCWVNICIPSYPRYVVLVCVIPSTPSSSSLLGVNKVGGIWYN